MLSQHSPSSSRSGLFVREHVLSSEVELLHVLMVQQVADIFTKPLGLDKLRQFSGALGVQYLDMPNLRGRNEKDDRDAESDTDFDFSPTEEVGVHGTTEEAETRHKGIH